LIARVKITSYNLHCSAPFFRALVVSATKSTRKEEPTTSSNQPYSPYGETYAQSGLADFSFTGMNDDADPTNPATVYDFPAREYGIQGRWPSPDPAGLGAVDPAKPQSWNRYAYALNNPLAVTDPSGMCGALSADDPFDLIDIGDIGDIGDEGGGGCLPWNIVDFEEAEEVGATGSSPEANAPPAPPGGYGAGIDPYGTWDEELPAGVQALPNLVPGGPTFGGSGCDFLECGLMGNSFDEVGQPYAQMTPGSGPCAYLNDQGTDIEIIDYSSSAAECGGTGGFFAMAPQVNGVLPNFKVNPNGDVTHHWTLSPEQCNQMNQGLNRMNVLTTILGTVIRWFGGAAAGLSQAGASIYLNNGLCGGPPL
jgi:RHS repeat-associated protein